MAFPVSIERIREAEADIGARFPETYAKAMMEDNGGVLRKGRQQWWLHPIKDFSDKKRIKRTCNHVLHETNGRREYGGFPENGVEIAGNGGGDALVLCHSDGQFSDELFFFDHEKLQLKKLNIRFGDMKKERG
ncbi:SMI1/KNR4 family protein [Cognatiyoonia sp. IB215182]|uniref:SMI1/KNR4 family protein n=1 Tax=Cognatiyoonia sp. IB215182 TaxID=3097353 RepID=UPI002A0E1958|nr:SMI1/KNR4 family protein [Cognatiyoonia sp. IB215182]MDX8352590.1 SMI1/KNR4 family protein [Cognatiyoonia sp. IB215182]